MHASAPDYASLLRSDEAASLEAALSFLSDCDDNAAGIAAGHSSEAAAWRLLQDANGHDLDVDIVESHDDNSDSDSHGLHHHLSHFGSTFKRSAAASLPKDEQQRSDASDDEMLSALLAAEHLPTMHANSPDNSNAQAYAHTHASPWSNAQAGGDGGFVSHDPGAFAHDAGEYKPQHNPGLMMAMMSAGFPDLTYNPQSLLLPHRQDDGSSSPVSSNDGGSPTGATPTMTTKSSSPSSTKQRSPTSSTAVVKKRASKKKPAGYNSNRARDERKEELIYLRKTVAEMEARLSKLQQNAPPPALPASTTSAPATSAVTASVVTTAAASSSASARTAAQQQLSQSVWEDIATRQYKERRRAELENIRLKLILEGQIKMAKALEKILKKRTSMRILESVRGGGKRVKCVHHPGSNDAAIFADLLAGVEKTLEEVDGVFEANGLGRMQTAYRDAQLRHDDASGMVMEIFANKVMPFDVTATASAVWRHYAHSMEHMPSRSHYQKQPPHIETPDDTLVESYGLELHGSRTKGNFICKQVMRKFAQRERIVIGWRAQAEAVDLSAEPTAGIRLVERGYTVIKALPLMATPHTLVQTCYIIRPHVYDEIADQERKVGALTDFILNCIAGTISASHQMIENFLLDQALQRK